MSGQQRLTTGIVDNDVLVLDAIRHGFERYRAPVDVLWAVTSANLALQECLAANTRPQVLLTDMEMPEMNGATLAEQLCAAHIPIAITGITAFDQSLCDGNPPRGFSAILPKEAPVSTLVRAMGHAAGIPQIAQWNINVPTVNPLSAMEREVLRLYAEGKTTDSIARQLSISVTTAKTHAQRAFRKLHAHNRTEAIAISIDNGWLR